MESWLTAYFIQTVNEVCGEPSSETADSSTEEKGLIGYCDSGHDRTPIQPDHRRLKADVERNTLPCRFYTREGRRVDSFETLTQLAQKARDTAAACEQSEDQTCTAGPVLHLTAVPAGRVFMFAPSFVGEKFVVDHVPESEPIVVEVLNMEPRLFELHGFFSKDEATQLIEHALTETSETHKLHRSTTGAVSGSIYKYVYDGTIGGCSCDISCCDPGVFLKDRLALFL